MTLYRPFIDAIKLGDVPAYERQLELSEKRLMERGTYLIVERARESAVRGLLKKACVHLCSSLGGALARSRPARTIARAICCSEANSAAGWHARALARRWILESKPARMPVETFQNYYNAAWRVHYRRMQGKAHSDPIVEDHFSTTPMGTSCIDPEETECLLANMIFKVRHTECPAVGRPN